MILELVLVFLGVAVIFIAFKKVEVWWRVSLALLPMLYIVFLLARRQEIFAAALISVILVYSAIHAYLKWRKNGVAESNAG